MRERIKRIKKFLDEIDVDQISVIYDPQSNFSNKQSYPLDFQIFMEQIGELVINTNADCGATGYQNICLEKPRPFCTNEAKFCEDETNVYDYSNRTDGDYFTGLRKNININASDINGEMYGFDTTYTPYKFVSAGHNIKADDKVSFLDWFEHFLQNQDNLGYQN